MRALGARAVRAMALLVATATMALLGVVLAPAAFAASPTSNDSAGSPVRPVELASTGLDVARPVIIGLVALVLGVALVCWAFLGRSPAGER